MKKITFLFCCFILVTISCNNKSLGTKASSEKLSADFVDNQNKAFLIYDKALKMNNVLLQNTCKNIIASMEVTTNTKTNFRPLVDAAKKVLLIGTDYKEYLKGLREQLVEESGGVILKEEAFDIGLSELARTPKNLNDKKTPERIFVSGQYDGEKRAPKGPVLESRKNAQKEFYLELVAGLWDNGGIKGTIFQDPNKKEGALTGLEYKLIFSNREYYNAQTSNGQSWSEFTFSKKTVGSIYPMFRKFENDVLASELVVINFLAAEIGKLELIHDKFEIFAQSSKPYVHLGEAYRTEISLGAYSTRAKFVVSVNGRSLPVVDGKAVYTTKGSSIGTQSYRATITVLNPLTGEMETFKKTFYYEIGE
jgi:hypothetical protein